MHHSTDRIAHTTAFDKQVLVHWRERDRAQRVHHVESIRRPIAPWANALTTQLSIAPSWRWWLFKATCHFLIDVFFPNSSNKEQHNKVRKKSLSAINVRSSLKASRWKDEHSLHSVKVLFENLYQLRIMVLIQVYRIISFRIIKNSNKGSIAQLVRASAL